MNPPNKHLINADPVLEKIIKTIPAQPIESTNNVFHDLMSCILEQQIHYRSTKKVFQKMLDKSGIKILTPENFPEFEKKAFEGVKLSVKKYQTVLDILEHWKKKEVEWTKLSNQEIREELSQINGVGKWTIEMILIYTLNRPDEFAYDDFHIKQIMTSLYHLNPASKLKAQMVDVSEPWSPYKSTAFLQLLAWKKFNKKKNK